MSVFRKDDGNNAPGLDSIHKIKLRVLICDILKGVCCKYLTRMYT